MKPSQQLAAMAVAGLCGTAFSVPQIPYYTSRFPQHPQNLGYGGDYPKYWQGEAYSPPQEATTYYNPALGPPASPASPASPAAPVAPVPPLAEERPSFTDRKYPAREAIKYYGGNQFPVNEGETSNEADKNVQNIKIKNDTPIGENDKSFVRINRPHGIAGISRRRKAALESEEAPEKKSGGLESIADIAVPEFNGITENKDEGEPENWNSFTFGVVSDTLVYHDPYEDRGGDFERKTNAMEKIEMMMGLDYKKDSKNKRSLSKRDWPEHIQEKARKMIDSATNMQTKGQKTLENDPAYQESQKAKKPTPEPVAPPKSTFPVAPKAKNPPPAPPKQPQPPAQQQQQPKKKPVGSGGGGLVPPGKSEKLGKAKSQPPQQQESRPQPNQSQPSQSQNPRNQKAPRPPSSPNQPRQPNHKQPSQQKPNRDVPRKAGNSKQPQQANFPSQDLPRKGTKGSGLNTPNQRTQNPQKSPQLQNKQKKPAQNNKKTQQKPQQNPRDKLSKRHVPVPAGPGYPPGTTIIRRPYIPPQGAISAPNIQRAAAPPFVNQVNAGQFQAPGQIPTIQQIPDGQIQRQYNQQIAHIPAPGQIPTIQQIPDGQIQRQYNQQIAHIPAPAPAPIPVPVPVPVPAPAVAPFVLHQNFPAPVPITIPVQRAAETVQFAAIVHPGKVICPENKPCPQPQPEYVEKTVMQPVQNIWEVPVIREALRAVPKLEAVEVMREVDVIKEKQVEKQVCESCERAKPKTITVCAECREPVDECTCYGENRGRDSKSYSRTSSNGKEATAYGGPGPVSGPGGLEAFFRQRMPEHFN